VSVGSLYQYFPSKEALVAALVERHIGALMLVPRTKLVEVASAPLDRAARELVRAVVQAHLVNPELHKVLMEQVPRVGRLERLASYDRETCELVRAALELRAAEIRPADLDLAAFVLTHAVEGIVHAAVSDPCATFGEDALVREVAELVLGYLRR
jgi:AcrR family transcriptional regulator